MLRAQTTLAGVVAILRQPALLRDMDYTSLTEAQMAEVRSVLRTGALAELQPLLHHLEDANVEKEPKQARHEAHATPSTPAFAATLPHAGARSVQAVATPVDMLVSLSPGAAASSGSTLPHPASEVQQPQQISQQTMLQMQQVIQQHIQQPQQIRQQIPLSASMATIMGAMTPVTSSVLLIIVASENVLVPPIL